MDETTATLDRLEKQKKLNKRNLSTVVRQTAAMPTLVLLSI